MSNAAGQAYLQVDSIPTYAVAGSRLYSDSSATGCFPTTGSQQSFVLGSASKIDVQISAINSPSTGDITFSQANNGLSGAAQVFNGCPNGTNFLVGAGNALFNIWMPQGLTRAQSYQWGGLWLDKSTWTTPIAFGSENMTPGGVTLSATLSSVSAAEGWYMTNVAAQNTDNIFASIALVENSTSAWAPTCATNPEVMLNVSCFHTGLYNPDFRKPLVNKPVL